MTDMQRYRTNHISGDFYPDPDGELVLFSDAEAVITAAEQRGLDKAISSNLAYAEGFYNGTEQGQRDMLAKCIAAVEEWALENPYEHPSPNRIIAALRALQEKP